MQKNRQQNKQAVAQDGHANTTNNSKLNQAKNSNTCFAIIKPKNQGTAQFKVHRDKFMHGKSIFKKVEGNHLRKSAEFANP